MYTVLESREFGGCSLFVPPSIIGLETFNAVFCRDSFVCAVSVGF